MKKGFTLIELLIVIGILAILTAAVVIVLNPAELLKQARDSQRMTDLDAMKNAIALYLGDGQLFTGNTYNLSDSLCYVYTGASSSTGCGGRFASGTATVGATTAVVGTGWIPLNFSLISSGSPLSALPIDPSQGATYFYALKGYNASSTYEINAALESTKYATKLTSDGGNSGTLYEVGTDPGLDL